jgi:hypothetical protein
MSKRTPYIPPHLIHYASEADCPDWLRDAVKSMRQELQSRTSPRPRLEVKPEFITVVDGDKKVRAGFGKLLPAPWLSAGGIDRQALRRSNSTEHE